MRFNITKESLEYLSQKDAVLGEIIKQYGILEIELRTDLFASLVSTIIGQQLSNKAAETIVGRVRQVVGEFTTSNFLSIDTTELRKCGVSNQKISYIVDLATKSKVGEIDLESIESLDDKAVIEYLQKIKGIGKWSAEMTALFSLGRMNIFCYEDVALRNAIMKFHSYKTLSPRRFETLRNKYNPYCSIASIYYYHAYDNGYGKIN